MTKIFQTISFRKRRPQWRHSALVAGVRPLHEGQTRCVVAAIDYAATAADDRD